LQGFGEGGSIGSCIAQDECTGGSLIYVIAFEKTRFMLSFNRELFRSWKGGILRWWVGLGTFLL